MKQKNAPKVSAPQKESHVAAVDGAVPATEMSLGRKILAEPLALGLIPLIMVRPWLDGVTYPTDNFYFVWWTILLSALWLARALVRHESIRFWKPMLLLGGLWVVALLTASHTAQYDATYRSLIMWAGHFLLFALAANALRTPTAISIVLSAYVASVFLETVWSVVHFRYVLAMVRDAVVKNPGLLKTYFGSETPNAELIHRLQVNRAFGSLLFPNALAAFLILSIPVVLGCMVQSVRTFSLQRRQPAGTAPRPAQPLAMLLISGISFLVVAGLGYFILSFIHSSGDETTGGTFFIFQLSPVWSVLWVCIFPVVIATAVGWTLARYGYAFLSLSVRMWVLPPLLIVQLAALWLTYSRGGIMALVAAAIAMVCLALVIRRTRIAGSKASMAAVLALFIAAYSAVMSGAMAQDAVPAQPAPAPVASSAPPAASSAPVAPVPPAPAPVASSAPAQPAPAVAAPAASPSLPITREGEFLTMQDLMNPASFHLRLTYWKTGLAIAKDNFLLGVGLGNFGTVYPKYQSPGAGDVKTAHNDYLQMLCETGLIGFVLFCAFWGYFLVWGARRLMREKDGLERWVLGGLYAGVLAFLLHSLVDFNFFNPALAFFAFLVSGIFYARASVNEPIGTASKNAVFLPLGLMVWGAIVAGMALQVFMSDRIVGGYSWINVGNTRATQSTFNAGEFFLRQVDAQVEKKQYPVIDMQTAVRLIPDRSALTSCGSIRVPVEGTANGHRELRADEPVPMNAFLVVTSPAKAHEVARNYADLWLEELGYADAIYPHNPELAAHFIQWYDLLATSKLSEEFRKKYTTEFVKWCERGVERSPEHFIYHEWYAKALWLRGNMESGPGKNEYFQKGLAEYRKAAELYPINIPTWRKYADALTKYGKAVSDAGDKAQGESYLSEAQKVRAYIKELRQKMAPGA